MLSLPFGQLVIWCESHHHCLLCLGYMGDWILSRFMFFTIIVNFKAGLLQICMGCHQQCGDHYKVNGKGFILVQVLSRWYNLTGRYELLNWSLFAHFRNLVNFQSSVAPKPMVVSPQQMYITGINRLSTFIQRKSELHSPLRYGVTTAQSTVLRVMLITLRV